MSSLELEIKWLIFHEIILLGSTYIIQNFQRSVSMKGLALEIDSVSIMFLYQQKAFQRL